MQILAPTDDELWAAVNADDDGRGAYEHSPIGLTAFKRDMYRRYQHSDHLQMLDEHLEQVVEYVESEGKSGIGRLIVEMPPRHGKTLTVSRLLPAWFLGRKPDKRLMLVSYGASLAHKNSRYVRNLINSPRYREYFDIELAHDSKAADAWDLHNFEGGCDALGVLGGATGKGAHLLINDDLIKNRQEAESDVIRERTWDALNDDLMTRLEPGGAVILMATRWHMDDPTGRALKDETEGWVRLRLPALAEEDDVLDRGPGEPLWSWRYPLEVLRKREAAMGPYSWSALYQQNPVPAEGGIFKLAWFQPYIDVEPEIVWAVRYWDLAMSEKTTADYSVGVTMGQAVDGHFYVLDVSRVRLEWGDVVPHMAEVIIADGKPVAQGVEEKGFMSRAIQELNNDPRLHGFQIWGYPVDTDKVTRALPYAAKCAAGTVHVMNRHWTQSYVEELTSFPNGAHDDQVDASSGAWAMLDGMAVLTGQVVRG